MTTLTNTTSTNVTTAKQTKKDNSAFAMLGDWLAQGARVYRNAPISLTLTSLVLMIIGGLVQGLPAPYGMFASKWLSAGLITLLWPLTWHVLQNGKFSMRSLKQYSGYRYLPALGVLMMLPFASQVVFGALAFGAPGVDLVLYQDMTNFSRIHVASVLMASAPLGLLMSFIPAYVLIKQASLKTATVEGIKLAFRAIKPLSLLMLLNMALMFSVPYTFVLSAILVGPLLFCVNVVAFNYLISEDTQTKNNNNSAS